MDYGAVCTCRKCTGSYSLRIFGCDIWGKKKKISGNANDFHKQEESNVRENLAESLQKITELSKIMLVLIMLDLDHLVTVYLLVSYMQIR